MCTCECELGTETDTDDMEKEGTDHDAFSFIPTKYFIQSIQHMPSYKQINTNVPSINKGLAASFDLTNSTSECKLRVSREEARRHLAHFIITQDKI